MQVLGDVRAISFGNETEPKSTMENTLFVALSRQLATRRQMDVIANNLANAASPGFKGEQTMFVEYLDRTGPGKSLSFVQDLALARNMASGNLSETRNQLDLAIDGPGWFVIETDAGLRYSRNGRFRLDGERQLVTAAGDAVLSTGDDPIVLGPGDTDIVVKSDGSVFANGKVLGRLSIVAFDNPQLLRKVSGNLYSSEIEPIEAEEASVVQGMVEDSNVQPVIEITRMLKALRGYQSTQTMIEREHERQQKAIEKLPRES